MKRLIGVLLINLPLWFFPFGSALADPFADNVVSFTPGTYLFGDFPPPSGDELKTISAPDGQTLGLGLGGEITLEFFFESITDGPGNDLKVTSFFPVGSELDNRAEVFVSSDGNSFVSLGNIGPAVASSLLREMQVV